MTITMSIKTDKEIKEKAQTIAKEMGFSLSTLLNAYMRQFIKTKEVNFSAEPYYLMSEKLEKELAPIMEDIKHGRNLSPKFNNAKDFINYLES
jgi:addiction module RelB/DinJ family antitoxin